jgi:hypothetical protein
MKEIKRVVGFKERKKRRDEKGIMRKELGENQGSQNTFDSLIIYSTYLRLWAQSRIDRSSAI